MGLFRGPVCQETFPAARTDLPTLHAPYNILLAEPVQSAMNAFL